MNFHWLTQSVLHEVLADSTLNKINAQKLLETLPCFLEDFLKLHGDSQRPYCIKIETNILSHLTILKSIFRIILLCKNSQFCESLFNVVNKFIEKTVHVLIDLLFNSALKTIHYLSSILISTVIELSVKNEMFSSFTKILLSSSNANIKMLSVLSLLLKQSNYYNKDFVVILCRNNLVLLPDFDFSVSTADSLIVLRFCTLLIKFPNGENLLFEYIPYCFIPKLEQIIFKPILLTPYFQFICDILPLPQKSPCKNKFIINISKTVFDKLITNKNGILEKIQEHKDPLHKNSLLLGCGIMLLLKSVAILIDLEHIDMVPVYQSTKNIIGATKCDIINIFMDRDDVLIHFLLLNIHLCVKQDNIDDIFHPHNLFNALLKNVKYSSSLLLDWLVSNETEFLKFFLQYVKFSITYWSKNNDIHFSCLKFILPTILELKTSIERLHRSNLFPYNPAPLIKHITTLEHLYFNSCMDKK